MSQQKYISDEQVVKRANCAVKIALEKKRAMDVPILHMIEKRRVFV